MSLEGLLPLTLMLSPRVASPKMSCASAIVNDVPPPPLAVVSSSSRAETADQDQLGSMVVCGGFVSLPIISTRPVNMVIDGRGKSRGAERGGIVSLGTSELGPD